MDKPLVHQKIEVGCNEFQEELSTSRQKECMVHLFLHADTLGSPDTHWNVWGSFQLPLE